MQCKITKISGTGIIESKFPKCKVVPDVDKSEIHLFYMDNRSITILYKISILSDGSYYFVFREKCRPLDLTNCTGIPQLIHDKNHLYLLMKSLEKFNICSGVAEVCFLRTIVHQYLRQLMVNLVHLLRQCPQIFTRSLLDLQSVLY